MTRHAVVPAVAAVGLFATAAMAVLTSVLVGPAVHRSAGRAAVGARVELPLTFERNVGQADRAVRFLAHGPRGTLYLTSTEAIVALRSPSAANGGPDVLRMRLRGAKRSVAMIASQRQRGAANYLIGSRRARWQRRVRTFGRVTYRNVYRGIDLVYHATSGQLEYDFDLAPAADPSTINLQLRGARHVHLDDHGRLHVRLAHRTLIQDAPSVYQYRGGVRHAVSGRYVLRGARHIGFAVGAHDRAKALVIDPTIAYSTYLGGSGNDVGTSIAVDRAGNTYVAGSTSSTNLRLRHPVRSVNRGQPIDAFVAKISPLGRLVYATYLGASAYTDARSIAVDRTGHAYVTGATGSQDFPTRHAIQPDYGGGPFDAYVTKLDVSGSRLMYSTYNGGPHNDRGYAIAVDATGAAVATGRTAHDGFPTTGRLKPGPEGGAFVTKIDPSGQRLVYSTVLGGSDPTNSSNTAFAVALDSHADAYVTGITAAPDFPTVRALQSTYGGGRSNAFVTKVNARGTAIVYSTYLGGSGEDEGIAIAVDRTDSAYITGHTTSKDFPTSQPPLAGGAGDSPDAFVTKLTTNGSALSYSAYLGGSSDDTANAIAVDQHGNAYITGTTTSLDYPTTPGAVQRIRSGPSDAFLTSLSPSGSRIAFSTYLGGSGADAGLGLALDQAANAYLTGQTASPNLTTVRSIQSAPSKRAENAGGGGAAFVAKITARDLARAHQ
jgi:Beta-propeller repeat